MLNEKNLKDDKFDIVFFLDVLEHMSDNDIDELFLKLNANLIVCRIPVAKNKNEDFFLEVSRKDKTHINCKTKNDWISTLTKHGFNTFVKVSTLTFYDSEGVFCFLAFKNNYNNI